MVSRKDRLSAGIMLGGIVAAAIALAVTAAVTKAYSQPAVSYAPVITNLKTSQSATWKRHPFPSKQTCVEALGTLPQFLAAVRDANPDAKVEDPTGNKVLVDDVTGVVLQLWMNTGVLPHLSISCEAQGSPA